MRTSENLADLSVLLRYCSRVFLTAYTRSDEDKNSDEDLSGDWRHGKILFPPRLAVTLYTVENWPFPSGSTLANRLTRLLSISISLRALPGVERLGLRKSR